MVQYLDLVRLGLTDVVSLGFCNTIHWFVDEILLLLLYSTWLFCNLR